MGDARQNMSQAKRSELDSIALDIVRGSILEKAAARFLSQIVAELHVETMNKHQAIVEKLEDRIAELEQRLRWIPVEERLPEVGEEVYTLGAGAGHASLYTYGAGSLQFTDALQKQTRWECSEGGETIEHVTHWLPIPPIEQEGGE